MAKRTAFLTILVLALPLATFASSGVDFTNSGGTLSGTKSGLALGHPRLCPSMALTAVG